MRARLLFGLWLAMALGQADAQILLDPDYHGDLNARSTLTGDWGGRRGEWARRGLHVDPDSVLSYQGVVSGGREEDGGVIGSSSLTLQLDTGKAGLWPGGLFKLRSEARYGDGVQRAVGGVSPVNSELLLPTTRLGDDTWALTEFTFAQFLSESVGVFAGLLNTEEGDANELGGSLRDNGRFLNTAFRLSLPEGQTAPNVTLGAGIIFLPTQNIVGSVTVFDTEESAGRNPFDTRSGTSVATEWQFSYALGGRGGRSTLGFIYAFDQDFTRLGVDPRSTLRRLVAGQGLATRDDSWVAYYNAHQYLQWENGRGWGLFARLSIADASVNPVQWSAAFGAGGTGLFASRPRDTWGIGIYHLDLADGPVFRLLDLHDEDGMEIFYNFAVTPWFHLTADLQVVDTALGQPGVGALPLLGPGGLLPVAPGLATLRESETAWILFRSFGNTRSIPLSRETPCESNPLRDPPAHS
jgi:porin